MTKNADLMSKLASQSGSTILRTRKPKQLCNLNIHCHAPAQATFTRGCAMDLGQSLGPLVADRVPVQIDAGQRRVGLQGLRYHGPKRL